MKSKTICRAGFVAACALLFACSPKADRGPEQVINASATVSSTNDTLRVNQPRAYQRGNAVVAQGTNVELLEAAGANRPSSSDAALADRIKTMLKNDTALAPLSSDMHVAVENGRIILTGTVKTDAQKLSIDEKIRGIAGDNKIENRLHSQETLDLTPLPNQKPLNP